MTNDVRINLHHLDAPLLKVLKIKNVRVDGGVVLKTKAVSDLFAANSPDYGMKWVSV